jgi:exodeoxyribonuclease-3
MVDDTLLLVSWNVNGLNAAIKNGFLQSFSSINPDIMCLQETKVTDKTLDKAFKVPPKYYIYWNQAEKAGYSGTMVLTRIRPFSVKNGLGKKEFDSEGRVQTLEFDSFYLINCYFPNAQRELMRIDYKLAFNERLLAHVEKLREKKNVIITGDFNVAHKEIDIANPKGNEGNAGFSEPERAWFTKLLENGYIDTFRKFHPEPKRYSWWSYMGAARAKNIGWRIDYFVVNKEFEKNLIDADIYDSVKGSDHCPISVKIRIS